MNALSRKLCVAVTHSAVSGEMNIVNYSKSVEYYSVVCNIVGIYISDPSAILEDADIQKKLGACSTCEVRTTSICLHSFQL
jgi:hypothetical protein